MKLAFEYVPLPPFPHTLCIVQRMGAGFHTERNQRSGNYYKDAGYRTY